MSDIHGYDAESSLGFCSFIQFGHDEIQTLATLGASVSAFDGIALTGITVELSLNVLIRGIGLSSTERRAGKADVMSFAESAVFSGLVNPISQDRFGVAAKFSPVIFCYTNQFLTLIETVPTGLFQVGEAVNHR